MFISDSDKKQDKSSLKNMPQKEIKKLDSPKKMIKATIVQSAFAIFCVIFSYVYGLFSFGESSWYMTLMFLVPLIGGTLVSVLSIVFKFYKHINRVVFNLWNSGLAVFAFGCLFKGIVEISGRFTDNDIIFWCLGGVFILASAIAYLISYINYKN